MSMQRPHALLLHDIFANSMRRDASQLCFAVDRSKISLFVEDTPYHVALREALKPIREPVNLGRGH